MKKYILLSVSLLFATAMHAQKSEIRTMKRILDKQNPTEADYKELQGLIDTTTPYIGNAKPEEQAEFYFYKGRFESLKAEKTSSVEALRSEEHTSELQSRPHLVCRLLLEKKKK